jgi:PAS domain S-box-containing protein
VKAEGALQDITERMRAEEALKRNLAVLAKSQEIGHLGNWSLDFETGKFEASDEDYRIYGFEPQSVVLLDHVWPMIHPDDLERYREYVEAVRQEGRLGGIDYRIVWSDGSLHYVNALTDNVVRGPDGRVKMASGITQDITERKRAEETLRRSEAALKRSQEMTRVNNWALNFETGELGVSDQAFRNYGYEVGAVKPTLSLYLSHIHPDDKKKVEEYLERMHRGELGSLNIASARRVLMYYKQRGDIHS